MSCPAVAPKAASASASRCKNWRPLRLRSQFLHLQAKGHTWVTPCFVLQALRGDTDLPPHFGLTVTKKMGGAVVRNRIRRRLRSVIDACPALPVHRGWQFVLIARAPSLTTEFTQLQRDLAWAIKRVAEKMEQEGAAC